MPISKTDFVRGLQCEKMLWLDAHAPEHRIIPPEVQAKLDAGNDFGDKAMGVFGDFTETTYFKPDGRMDYAGMLEKTKALIDEGAPVICEAAFTWYGNYCAADILKKNGEGYLLYEVKNTYFPRKEFITDLGFQRLILRKNGVNVLRSFLLLRGDEPPQDFQPSESVTKGESVEILQRDGFLYKAVDVTKAAKITERIAEKRIFELGKLKRKDAEMPPLGVGEHCEKPYRCWYYEYCHKQ
jgi:hypothetical protein